MVFKQILHISVAIVMSAIIAIEAIGFYITKDTCEPCGSSSIAVDLLKPLEIEAHTHDTHCCTPLQDHSECYHDSACAHNEKTHDHHQENYYLTYSPDFFERVITPNFSIEFFAVLRPIISPTDYINISLNCNYKIPPLPDAKDSYRAILCTYLL